MANSSDQGGSTLLLDEQYASESADFLDTLRKVDSHHKLASLADRWKRDSRPWAREQILEYLSYPLDRFGHEPLVKRLFKQAEEQRDDELMAAFLVAFDRLVRRERRTLHRYDWQARRHWEEEALVVPSNRMPREKNRTHRNWRNEPYTVPVKLPRGARLFGYPTRHYLRRRAWRYFRRMAFQTPDAYPRAVAASLKRYCDDDFVRGENILDNWAMMHICFGASPVVTYDTRKFLLRDGRTMSELQTAPRFVELWQTADSFDVLFDVLAEAQSQLVRVWALDVLKAHHGEALSRLEASRLLKLFDRPNAAVHDIAAELLASVAGLATMSLETWLKLLETRSPNALAVICDAMTQHVSAGRLSLEQCVTLTCAKPTPVAQLGFEFLKTKPLQTESDRKALTPLADAQCAAIGHEVATWALQALGSEAHYDRDGVVGFFDSLSEPVRRGAWEWLTPQSPGHSDPGLWAKLSETPFDDVKMQLIEALERRAELPGTGADRLEQVWCSVVLGVHRGGRQKPKAVRQIAAAIEQHPTQASRLLPILVAAVRSIRGPERRAGLAAIVGLAERCPELAAIVRATIPELILPAAGGERSA